MKAKRHHLSNLALVIGSLLLCALGGELALRALDPPYYHDPNYAYHPRFGWTNSPNRRIYSYRDDIPRLLEFNSLGIRDHEFPPRKPPRTKRIAALGDSFVEAMQVNLPETFWKKAAAKLAARDPRFRWEALGFGVGNYGPVQEWLMLEEVVPAFEPDAVVLEIYPLNDISNSSLGAGTLRGPDEYHRPYLEPGPAGGPWRLTYLRPLDAFFQRRSYLYRFGSLLLFPHLEGHALGRSMVRAARARAQELGAPDSLEDQSLFPFLNLNVFAEPAEQFPFIRQGWAAADEAIRRIAEKTRAMGIPLVVVVIPSAIELTRASKTPPKQFGYTEHQDYAERRIRALLAPYPNATVPPIREPFLAEREKLLPYIDGHLNPAGHELLATLLEKTLNVALPQEAR